MALASREFRECLALGSFVAVADRGMVSATNLAALCEDGIDHNIAERLRRKASHEALSRAGHDQRVTPTIEVKEVSRDGVGEPWTLFLDRLPLVPKCYHASNGAGPEAKPAGGGADNAATGRFCS